MSEEENNLSPLEFLAELKSQVETETGVETADPGGPDPDGPDVDGPDFSDLEETDAEGASDTDADNSQQPLSHSGDSEDLEGDSPSDGTGSSSDEATALPESLDANSRISALFDRVHTLLDGEATTDEAYRPKSPETLEDTRLSSEEIERLILKFLLAKGSATGRAISAHIRIPFNIVDSILKQLKQDQLVLFKGAAQMGDYDFAITDLGRERARRYAEECTYFGAAPVTLADYLKAMEVQSIGKQEVTEEELREAFSDLIISDAMFEKLGPAINSGRGMFLFGEPGNGKTSIAERVTQCFGSTIWIPRALGIDGEIIRLYDPGVHQVVDDGSSSGIFDLSGVDQRWVQIVRPTVISGGELTMDELEVCQNLQTKICESPLQLKSNCGTLVIDDFGRQTMPIDVLLNRWIVPLEKRYDFLNLPSGKKIQVPFDQLIIFSTNLEPKDLVDGAFLRRIPYKIEVPDPTEDEFRALCQLMAPIMGFEYDAPSVEYLIETHYKGVNRPFRACQPRDLLLQVKNYCVYKRIPKVITPAGFDFAVENYFSVM